MKVGFFVQYAETMNRLRQIPLQGKHAAKLYRMTAEIGRVIQEYYDAHNAYIKDHGKNGRIVPADREAWVNFLEFEKAYLNGEADLPKVLPFLPENLIESLERVTAADIAFLYEVGAVIKTKATPR
jgi:hypothetical protein